MALTQLATNEPKEEPPSGRRALFPDATDRQWNDWTWQLRNAAASLETLLKFSGPLSNGEREKFKRVLEKFPAIIPPYYLSIINFDNPRDPVRMQAFPSLEEIDFNVHGVPDPLEEEEDMAVPGLIHRYPDRVLMQITNICPMNCRHCTRKREWEEGKWARTEPEIERMIEYLSQTPEVRDVLISGGDPLILSNAKLEKVLAKLRAISHIEIVRFGTRFPVVLPQRIDEELCALLKHYRPLWVNTHFNHPQEITPEARAACDRLICAGIPMNNQTVLMKGVNDSVAVIKKLCQELVKMGVRPYYLYQCDMVRGTEHFQTDIWKGLEIIEGLRGHTTGFAVPQFVVDAPGGGGKVPLSPNYLLSAGPDYLLLRNYEGLIFKYQTSTNESRNGIVPFPTPSTLAGQKSQRLERRRKRREDNHHVQSQAGSRTASEILHIENS
ncbi:MAG: KamA family radical SAM protein [Candidatus Omnitrophica bacterium]|nr:KamA family radical SAM protein [Candidatus Omnitrophota bacterium]